MGDEAIETIGGSGNVFRDFGYPDADVRQAEARTGVAHSEFARIRRANFTRFTIDRLMAILGRLGQEVELTVSVHPRVASPRGEAPHSTP